VTKIGRDLSVRYVLEGSVQRGGSRMRVNVQLIDAASGNHLWAERGKFCCRGLNPNRQASSGGPEGPAAPCSEPADKRAYARHVRRR
jgi:hypothetical protein